MCGRYGNSLTTAEVSELFAGAEVPEAYVPRYNVAPGQEALIATATPGQTARLRFARWGFQSAGGTSKARPINARSETVAGHPAFRAAFREGRCLVPASGFFEWRRIPEGKLPYWIHGEGPIAFAALTTPDASGFPTFTILTRPAPDGLAHIHDRVPVLVARGAFGAWLDRNADRSQLVALIRAPFPPLRAYPVSTRVNHVDQDDPDLLRVEAEPLELPLE